MKKKKRHNRRWPTTDSLERVLYTSSLLPRVRLFSLYQLAFSCRNVKRNDNVDPGNRLCPGRWTIGATKDQISDPVSGFTLFRSTILYVVLYARKRAGNPVINDRSTPAVLNFSSPSSLSGPYQGPVEVGIGIPSPPTRH